MTAADAHAIAAWRYPGEYSFYDADADPEDLAELLDPAEWGQRYFAADELADHTLAGLLVVKLSGSGAEISLGLRPDLTGQLHDGDESSGRDRGGYEAPPGTHAETPKLGQPRPQQTTVVTRWRATATPRRGSSDPVHRLGYLLPWLGHRVRRGLACEGKECANPRVAPAGLARDYAGGEVRSVPV